MSTVDISIYHRHLYIVIDLSRRAVLGPVWYTLVGPGLANHDESKARMLVQQIIFFNTKSQLDRNKQSEHVSGFILKSILKEPVGSHSQVFKEQLTLAHFFVHSQTWTSSYQTYCYHSTCYLNKVVVQTTVVETVGVNETSALAQQGNGFFE